MAKNNKSQRSSQHDVVEPTVELPIETDLLGDVSSDVIGDQPSLDQVRELLFGHQNRRLQHQMQKLNHSIKEESDLLRREVKGSIDELEKWVRSEFSQFHQTLDDEKFRRDKTTKTLVEEIKKIVSNFESKLDFVQKKLTQTENDLKNHAFELNQELEDEMQAKQKELELRFAEVSEQLESSKTDRTFLSKLLTDLANQLERPQQN